MRPTAHLALAALVGAIALLASCQDDGAVPIAGPDARFAKPPGTPGGGGGSDPSAALAVTIPAGFDVAADGGGDYVDGTDDVAAQIFGSDNFGLDVRGSSKGKGKNKTVVDRRICLEIRAWSNGSVLPREPGEDACLDLNVTTSDPDDPPGGFSGLAVGATMTTAMRFLWAGPDGGDRWLRFGSKCEPGWTPDPASRAAVTATADGWTIDAGDAAHWCRFGPDAVEPHPLSGDPDGRVRVTVRFEASPL